MPSSKAIVAAALLFALGCSSACAGDFMPRSSGSFGAVGNDPATRATCADAPSAAMSESDVAAPSSPGATVVRSVPIHTSKHIGVDDVVSDIHAAVPVDGEDKPAAGAHKPRSNLRWQSLLPGVMK